MPLTPRGCSSVLPDGRPGIHVCGSPETGSHAACITVAFAEATGNTALKKAASLVSLFDVRARAAGSTATAEVTPNGSTYAVKVVFH